LDGPTVTGRPETAPPGGVRARAEAEARLHAIFESAAIGIAVVEPDGTIGDANAALAAMLGYPVAELKGRSHAEITHPDDVAEDRRLADELFAGVRSSYVVEKRYLREDGDVVWARLTASVVRDDDGTPRFGLAMVADITAERAADDARARAVARYRTLVETIPAVTYIWESTELAVRGPRPPDDAGLTYTSPQIEQLVGYTAEEWESDPMFWAQRIHPDDRDRVLAQTAASERDGSPYMIEHRYLAKDGRVVWVQDQAVLIERLPDGRPWRFQGVMVDITERKLAEESLAETTERLNAIVDGSPLAIMTVDLHGVVRTWNPAAEGMFGWAADEAIGRFMPDVPAERRHDFDQIGRAHV